jgi:hypothetical protein
MIIRLTIIDLAKLVSIHPIRLIESNNPSSRTRFEQLYKGESDADLKERMLLVLNVVYDDKHIPAAQVARDLRRSRTWASDWLKRYREKKE